MLQHTLLDARATMPRPLLPPSFGDEWARLDRFLMYGICNGQYVAGGHELRLDDLDVVGRCLAADRFRTLRRIVDASVSGLAPKNDPALFSLALAAKLGDDSTRRAAYAAVPEVCRDGVQLLRFVEHARRFGGWGRGMRSAVAAWFTARPALELARLLAPSPAIPGWTMRDVLRLAHPRAPSAAHDRLFAWAVTGKLPSNAGADPVFAPILGGRAKSTAPAIDEAIRATPPVDKRMLLAFDVTTDAARAVCDAIAAHEKRAVVTDPVSPITWAHELRVDVDVFAVYSDTGTWAGNVQPARALRAYRHARGIPAKLVVVGMTSRRFRFADPDDAGMLDVVGYDASTPPVIADFARA